MVTSQSTTIAAGTWKRTVCAMCGRTCTRLHPLTCRAFAPYRHLLRDERDRKLTPTEALQCPSAFRAYVIASNAYARAS